VGVETAHILQVHDELVFEAPEAEADCVCPLVSEVMRRAPEPAVALSVPLVADARAGTN
jgi:DNA polymerase I